MAEGNTSDGFCKSRLVLGDLTNRLGKRKFSVSGIKSSSSNDIAKRTRVSPGPCTENVALSIAEVPNENKEPNVPDLRSGFAVSDRLINVESGCDEGKDALMGNIEVHGGNKDIEILDLSGGIDVSRSVNKLSVGNDLVDGCGESGSFKGDKVASLKGPNSTDLEGGRALNSVATGAVCQRKLDLSNDNALQPININEANQELGDSFLATTSRTVSDTGDDCLNENKDFDCEDDHNADNLGSQCDCVILPQSQESRVFGVQDCDNMCGGTDSIKACTCSFCTKAAYIWLDLNYQDIKARVSAMKKSQKEASILAERSVRSKVIDKNGDENFTRVSKLESDLMSQWRSLFQHMADTCEEEGNQLEARLLPLAELREKMQNRHGID